MRDRPHPLDRQAGLTMRLLTHRPMLPTAALLGLAMLALAAPALAGGTHAVAASLIIEQLN
jgi:hypothetical protein